MKKIKYILIAIVCYVSMVPVYGDDVTISFPLTKDDYFIYEVTVKGNGQLVEEGQTIRHGVMEFQLSVGQTKTFTVQADSGYYVKTLTANGESLDTAMNRITIHGVSINCKLYVEFAKSSEEVKDSTNPTNPTNPSNPNNPKHSSEATTRPKRPGSTSGTTVKSDGTMVEEGNTPTGIVSGEIVDEKEVSKLEKDKRVQSDSEETKKVAEVMDVPVFIGIGMVVIILGCIYMYVKRKKQMVKEE